MKKVVMIGMIVCMVGILLGFILPWFYYLDLYSIIPTGVLIRGWHSIFILITGLVTIILAWFALRKDEPQKLFWASLISGLITLILSLVFWFINKEDSLVLDTSPRIGFWVMLISTAGITGFSLWILISPKAWFKATEQVDEEPLFEGTEED